jgi:hypothetical protein
MCVCEIYRIYFIIQETRTNKNKFQAFFILFKTENYETKIQNGVQNQGRTWTLLSEFA